jgi:uncharacterized protein (TIGR03086 family)
VSGATKDAARLADYRRACDGFADAVHAVGDRWDAPSPAQEGDAGQVFEHVMSSLEDLLLQPLDVVPNVRGGRDDREKRWVAATDALFPVLEQPGALDKRRLLVGILTIDVMVHAWDLSRAVGIDLILDPELCRTGYERALANRTLLEESGVIDASVSVPEDAPIQDRLLVLFGRDLDWG